jgi:hypothetical protein
LEHLRSIEAQKGATYKIDRHLTHGILTMESCYGSSLCVVCVQAGQAVDLEDVTLDSFTRHHEQYDTLSGVIVDRHDDPGRFDHFGPYRDGIVLTNGRSFPLAMIVRATVRVLTARNVAIPRREISVQVPDYGIAPTPYGISVSAARELDERLRVVLSPPPMPAPRIRVRELVDAD